MLESLLLTLWIFAYPIGAGQATLLEIERAKTKFNPQRFTS